MATATIIQATKIIPYTSSGGNSAGDVVTTNDRIGIIRKTVVAGGIADLVVAGVADFPNTLGTTINDGAKVTWDGTTVQTTLTTGVPLGVMAQAQTSADTTARVVFDSSGDARQVANASANLAKVTVTVPVGTLSLIADTNTFSVRLPYAFTVTAVTFVVDKPVTTASKKTTLTLSTTGGAVTGGVMAPDSTSVSNVGTTGATVAGSAISGANATQVAGSAIIITASSTTAFVEGTGHIEVTVTNNDLAALLTNLKASGIQASS